MSIIKNISQNIVNINDIGFELQPNETLDLNDLDVSEYQNSIDLPALINTGVLVYLDVDGVTELTVEESQTIHEEKTVIDLSKYYTKDEVQNLILAELSNMNFNATDIIHLPVFSVKSSNLKYGSSSTPDGSTFYKTLTTPYHVNQSTTLRQTVAEVSGSGYFTGLMLPRLKNDSGSNRKIEIFITIDGTEFSEEFTYTNDNNDEYRIFIGSAYGTKSGRLESGGGLLTYNDDDDDDYNTVSSDRRIHRFGVVSSKSDAQILHPMQFINDPLKPKIKFNSSLKIEYQLSNSTIYSTSSYKNRSVAFYMLGDY